MSQVKEFITVFVGDITGLKVDAIVNAANPELAGGGGVDGAIHRAARQDQLQAACRKIGGCPTGHVRVTPGFDLYAQYIFHAVGPVWHGGALGEAELLSNCYRQAMAEADKLGVESIAFPAISCGVYGYPTDKAIPVAVDAVTAALEELARTNRPLIQVTFCCFDQRMGDSYSTYLDATH